MGKKTQIEKKKAKYFFIKCYQSYAQKNCPKTLSVTLSERVNLFWVWLFLLPEIWVTKKFFTRTAANLIFYSIFRIYSLFFFSFFCFFCLFVCSLFFEIKNVYSDTHSTICGGVCDKKNFTRPIFGNKTTSCFGLNYSFFFCRIKSLTSFFLNYFFINDTTCGAPIYPINILCLRKF